MPNPYHDETGKFCSANEMQAAVMRLAGAGLFQQAVFLSQEYAAIGQANLEEAEAALTAFRGGTDATGVATPGLASTVAPVRPIQRERRTSTRSGAKGAAPQRGPRGYTTGSRQASAAAAAVRAAGGRDNQQPAVGQVQPRVTPISEVPKPTPAPKPEQASPAEPKAASPVIAALIDPLTSRADIEDYLREQNPAAAAALVRESGSARLALAYAAVHGWPQKNAEFEDLVLADPAMTPRRYNLIASRLQTPAAINKLVANRSLSADTLVRVAQNARLSPHNAVRLIERASDHPGTYAEIRSALLANPATGAYLRRHLRPTLQVTPELAPQRQAAATADKQARVNRAQGELDILTRTPDGEPVASNRQRVAHLRTQLAAARAALIASDPVSRAAVISAANGGNQQAKAALSAARGWALQQQDAAALRAANDLA